MAEEILTLTHEQMGELRKRFLHGSKVQEKSYVRVSEDRIKAWLYLSEPSGGTEKYKVDTLLDMLREEGVTAGYLMPRLVAMAKKGVYQREILVAEGKEVVEGSDGYYEYLFDTENFSGAPKILEDGSVDYGSMNVLQSVQVGGKLAEYHEAVGGEDGFTVDGMILKSKPVRELQPLRGRSIERRGNAYFAKAAGKVEVKAGNIDIRTVHEVHGDVDLSTGRIEFFGDVVISGNVSTGVLIRAGRNLVIEGTVECAELFAGGDIVLKRGVQGNMKGKVRARGNVFANFIEQCEVNAEINVEANYILNANVTAGGKVTVKGKKGSIIGGKVFALQGVTAFNLGNAVEVRTIVCAGYEREVYEKHLKMPEKQKEISSRLRDILERMNFLIKQKKFQGETDRGSLLSLNSKKDEYFKQLDDVKDEIEQCQQRMEKGRGATVNAEGVTNKGVIISINGYSKTCSGTTQYVTYRCRGGEIATEPFGHA